MSWTQSPREHHPHGILLIGREAEKLGLLRDATTSFIEEAKHLFKPAVSN